MTGQGWSGVDGLSMPRGAKVVLGYREVFESVLLAKSVREAYTPGVVTIAK